MGMANATMSEAAVRVCSDFRENTPPMAFRLDLPKFAGFTRFKLGMPSARIQRVK